MFFQYVIRIRILLGILLWACLPEDLVTSFMIHPISSTYSVDSSLFQHKVEPPMENEAVIHGYSRLELQQIGHDVFQPQFSFPLDSWQTEAGGGISLGWNVIVTAPTGAGKTAVGIMALVHALQTRHSSGDASVAAIYTTPLKALSNQKFVELKQTFGNTATVGLSTGDMCIQRGAVITVMTTEVYRNMCWKTTLEEPAVFVADRPSSGANSIVVLDEFHYMGHVGRGGVWEESVITSPQNTQIVALSATLSNAHSIGQWMEQVTGRYTLLVDVSHESRPVPLRYYFATTKGILPLFRDVDAGPGAPHGLLGLRGDYGTTVQTKKEKKGFGKTNPSTITIDRNVLQNTVPKGLHLHPTLVRFEEQRYEKIHKIMARQRNKEIMDTYKKSPTFNPKSMTKQEKKERDQLLRQEMRKSVPSISFLVEKLQEMKLLPAIFFIFSRVGCDNAAEATCQSMRNKATMSQDIGFSNKKNPNKDQEKNTRHRGKKHSTDVSKQQHRHDHDDDNYNSNNNNIVKDENGRSFRKTSHSISEDVMSSIMLDGNTRSSWGEHNLSENQDSLLSYSKCGLLSLEEVTQIVSRVQSFNEQNPEIKFDTETMNRFFLGVGSHHAGQLPAHKAFVETLFRAQLIKVVFATETLAAGINMPARTTVICSLAKRGDDSTMNLLETSSLLQMAGRAGRRGMDTDGTCIIVATPFEGPDSAIDILTKELKPVQSQFTPSYSLVVNLIARGNGTLAVAKTLVQSSFAYYEKKESEERIESAREIYGEEFEQVVETASHEHFLHVLIDSIAGILSFNELQGNQRMMHERVLQVLEDRAVLKKESKAYLSLVRIHDAEENTLRALKREAIEISSSQDDLTLYDDTKYLDDEIIAQSERLVKCKKMISEHVMTDMTIVANFLSDHESQWRDKLRAALNLARRGSNTDSSLLVSPIELSTFVKSFVSENRKRRKQDELGRSMGVSSPSLVNSYSHVESFLDDAWKDTIALTNVLKAYGCIVDIRGDEDSEEKYKITMGGTLLQEIGLENSLWCIVAMGGAWNVIGISPSKFVDDDSMAIDNNLLIPESQKEAASLISCLRSLDASEMAGYVSCLVSDEVRGSSSIVSTFESLTPTQKTAIQLALLSADRLEEVQRMYQLDTLSGRVQLELGACEVVTAWAAGCSWAEALDLSGLSPGDLIRSLHRALDALRQIGNLTYNPVRTLAKVQYEALGIHPEILALCREAALAMDRYPVKDTLLLFENDMGEDEEEKLFS